MNSNSKFSLKTIKKDYIHISVITVLILAARLLHSCYETTFEVSAKNIAFMLVCNLILTGIYSLKLYSYVVLLEKPIKAIYMILTAIVLSAVHSVLTGMSIQFAIADNLVVAVITLILLLANSNSAKKAIGDNYKHSKMKFKKLLNYTRKPIKTYLMIKIIMYSLVISLVMYMANNQSILVTTAASTSTRIYAAMALVIPLFTLISVASTTDLAYHILGLQIILELWTFIVMGKHVTLQSSAYIQFAAELYVVFTIISKLIAERKK